MYYISILVSKGMNRLYWNIIILSNNYVLAMNSSVLIENIVCFNILLAL